ncbi:MAG TPA: beta-eliminating lyase-related protein, partial [Steroidobacteraceae bacterium]|nr:beta-eliminating lyase-related protein [Steroidobacteraceae bacterium]
MTQPVYDFRSDNVAGVTAELMEALQVANRGTAAPYGDDDYTRAMQRRFAEVFERPVTVFPMSTGTGTNGVAL